MNRQELDSEYREKTDSELLRLAMNREQLTPEANVALSGELARRRIDSGTHLDAARLEEQDRQADNPVEPNLVEPGILNPAASANHERLLRRVFDRHSLP